LTYPSGKREEWSHCNEWPTHVKKHGEWSHCNGWPTQKKGWSHCNGWPTQVRKEKSGLIVMGDLPRKKDGLIVMGDLPKWKMFWRVLKRWQDRAQRDTRAQRRIRKEVGLENALPEGEGSNALLKEVRTQTRTWKEVKA